MFKAVALSADRLPEVRAFLQRVFGSEEDHPPFLLRTMEWKAIAPHPFWQGSRSYAVLYQDRIVGHGTLLPLRYLTAEGEWQVNCIVDWAADAEIRGGGAAVYQELLKGADLQIGIGGSEMARAALPRLRFKASQTVRLYERRERVVGHHLGAAMDWKTPLRMGRDVLRMAQRPALAGGTGLTARRVRSFVKEGSELPMPVPGVGEICSARTPAFLDYMLQCPIAEMEGYVLGNAGYCVLSRVGTSCRIADLWIDAPGSEEKWGEAVAVAVRLARANAKSASTQMWASTPFLDRVLGGQGFVKLNEFPFFMRGQKAPPDVPVLVSMLENDAFYLPG